jgi:molybdopterin-binding protein/molybdate transport repressor ModE-like protein
MFGFDDRTKAILRAVWKHGNVSAAARSLGLDPANARRHVVTASTRHGAPLIENRVGGRGGQNAALTREGRRFLERAMIVGVAGEFDEEQGTTPIRVGSRALHAAGRCAPGRVEVRLRPESVAIERPGPRPATSARNRFPMRVDAIEPRDEGTFLVRLAGGSLRVEALVTRGAMRELRLRKGARVVATIKAVAIEVGGPAQ